MDIDFDTLVETEDFVNIGNAVNKAIFPLLVKFRLTDEGEDGILDRRKVMMIVLASHLYGLTGTTMKKREPTYDSIGRSHVKSILNHTIRLCEELDDLDN